MANPGSDSARPGAPERIGRYRVVERIGRGAMGVVYRARDEAMGRDVALKVLMADLEDDPDIRTRFHREAEAAARLSHPNIITIFDVGEDGHRFFIVMELLKGLPLKDVLKQAESATLARKVDLMTQLCAGLGAAHNAQVFHRDIKPGNIFVRTDGILKILDFGVARLASSSMTASGFIVGTPDYMSPEQASGSEVDGRSDIFSLGGVFYFMLTGRKPFPASHLPTLFHQIQSEEPQPILGETPSDLAAVVLKALAKEPERRYQTCQEIAVDLEAVTRRHGLIIRHAPIQVRTGGAEAIASSPVPVDPVRAAGRTPASPAGVDTSDTVDLPVSAMESAQVDSTEDTVAIGIQPPWWKDALDRGIAVVRTAVMSVNARLGGQAAPDKQSGMRKGSM